MKIKLQRILYLITIFSEIALIVVCILALNDIISDSIVNLFIIYMFMLLLFDFVTYFVNRNK